MSLCPLLPCLHGCHCLGLCQVGNQKLLDCRTLCDEELLSTWLLSSPRPSPASTVEPFTLGFIEVTAIIRVVWARASYRTLFSLLKWHSRVLWINIRPQLLHDGPWCGWESGSSSCFLLLLAPGHGGRHGCACSNTERLLYGFSGGYICVINFDRNKCLQNHRN